jgi:PAS domain S-box-containing protein
MEDRAVMDNAVEAYMQAEKRYRMLSEQSFDAIVVIDPDTFFPVDFNKRAQDLFGYAKEEFPRIRITALEAHENIVNSKFRVDQMHAEEWDDFETEIDTKKAGAKNVKVSVRVVEISARRLLQCVFQEIVDGNHSVIRQQRGTAGPGSTHDKFKTLVGTLPICYVCKKICDEKGSWHQIEAYVGERSDVLFSHELCPTCEHRFYPKPLSAQKKGKGIDNG